MPPKPPTMSVAFFMAGEIRKSNDNLGGSRDMVRGGNDNSSGKTDILGG